MSKKPMPDQQTIEGDLRDYFKITTSTASDLATAQSPAGHHDHREVSLLGKVRAGIGLLVVVAVTVAAIGLRGISNHAPAIAPVPAIADGAAVVYDPGIHQVVMFGGVGSDGHVSSATWAWDGSAWSKLSPTASPPARQGASLGWDPAGRQLVLTGGMGDSKSATQSCSVPPLPGSAPGASGGGVTGSAGGANTGPGPVTISGSASSGPGAGTVFSGSASGGTVVNGSAVSSGVVTSGPGSTGSTAQCSTVSSTPLSDTWTFDGTTWTEQHPSTTPLSSAFGRTWLATEAASQTLVMVTDSGGPTPAIASSLCMAPNQSSSGSVASCAAPAFRAPMNNVFAWRSGNWVSLGTLTGNVSALATDPSTGNVAAVFSPVLSFSCGALTTSNGSASSTAIAMPCIAGATTPTASPPTTKVEELQSAVTSATWKTMSATGGPTNSITHAIDTAQYLLVVTADAQTWSFANDIWTELAKSGPPPQALGSAVLANFPTTDTSSSRALMFITAPGLASDSLSGGAVPLIPAQPKAATSDATWIWTTTWKQASGGVWPTMPPAPSGLGGPPSCTGGPKPLIAASPQAQISVCGGIVQPQRVPVPVN